MIVHIFQLLPDLLNGILDLNWPVFPVIFTSLMASTLSLMLTIISYIGNDRLHSEKRRIVCPGHMTAFIWHLCMIMARILALSLFAIAFGPYISVVIGIHWIACIIWTLFERTNFCGDVTTTPPKKRLYFELPFVLVISFVFIFLFFNVRDGSTMSRIVVYHILTSIETLVLCALFYALRPTLPYSPWLFALTVGLYIMGVAFMSLYYAAWHPGRTGDCFMVGIPYSCDCCYVFRKPPVDNITGNVDLPLDGDSGHGNRSRVNGVLAGAEDTGVSLTDYDPMVNLSTLAEHRSSFTIGQLSRSLTTTPSGTPQHGRGTPSIHGPSTGKAMLGYRLPSNKNGSRNGHRRTGSHHLSSTPIDRGSKRPASVNMESGPVGMGMGPRSLSERVGTTPEPNNHSGIGQLLPQRPASESIDVHCGSLTPTPGRHSRFRRSGSERYHRPPIPALMGGEGEVTPMSGYRSAPLVRRSEDFSSNHTHYNQQQHPPNGRHSVQNYYTGAVVLPSPIGEEPATSPTGLTSLGYQVTPPIILQVNGKSPNLSDRTKDPVYSVPCYPKNGLNRNHSNRWSDVNYTDFTPVRNSRNRYTNTPIRTRQRSPSPVSGGRGSPNPRSTNCTPKHSPYPGQRHRNPSNPLHSHNPMTEFTQLYTTNPSKDRMTSSGEHKVISTSSSYLISSDNHTDTDEEAGPVQRPCFAHNTLSAPKISIINKKHNQVKVTAHRQNSDEFLITKLQNINGTLV